MRISAGKKAVLLFSPLGLLSAPIAFGDFLGSPLNEMSPRTGWGLLLGLPCALGFLIAVCSASWRGWLSMPPWKRLAASEVLITLGYPVTILAVAATYSIVGPEPDTLKAELALHGAWAIGFAVAGAFAWAAVSVFNARQARRAAWVFLVLLPTAFGGIMLLSTAVAVGKVLFTSPVAEFASGNRELFLWTSLLGGNAVYFGAAGTLLATLQKPSSNSANDHSFSAN